MVLQKRKRPKLPHLRQISPRTCTIFAIQEGQTYAKYVIALPHNYQVGDIGEIAAHIVYLYRYENLPSSIALK